MSFVEAYQSVHTAIGSALRALPEVLRDLKGYHAGGPVPVLTEVDFFYLVRYCAERLRPLLSKSELGSFDAVLAIVDAPIPQMPALPQVKGAKDSASVRALHRAYKADLKRWEEAVYGAKEPPLKGLAAIATLAAKTRPTAVSARHLHMWLGKATALTAPALLEAHGEEGLRRFLSGLDARLMALEARQYLEGVRPSGANFKVLWRRAPPKGKRVQLIGRFDDGEHAAHLKLGARWQVVRGTRDEVLASIPDALFDSALRAALG